MPKEHKSLMRKLLAFYGQGGTAGMINLAIHRMYYGEPSSAAHPDGLQPILSPAPNAKYPGLRIALQTHDSITYQCPIEHLTSASLMPDILTYMEKTCTFKGVNYKVPCEVQIGFSWDKKIPALANNANPTRTVLTALGDLLKHQR